MARIATRSSVAQIAQLTGISAWMIRELEKREIGTVTLQQHERLQATFEGLGITFIPDDGVRGPGVRYLKPEL